MSLLTICQEAIRELTGFEVPTSIVGSSSLEAQNLLASAISTGEELVRRWKWQELKAEHSFVTVNTVASYDLPADFGQFAYLTAWNRSEHQPLRAVTPTDWQALKSSIIVDGTRFKYEISGDKFRIQPTPTAAYTIVYDYYSRYYCKTSGGVAIPKWNSDDNEPRLPEDIFRLGIIYRFLERKGLPHADHKANYYAAIDDRRAGQWPRPMVDLGQMLRSDPYGNMPEGGW